MQLENLFGIYVHWPYCRAICPYCDFNVYAAKSRDPGALFNALCTDLKAHAQRLQGQAITSLYFGGGTPSLLPAPLIERFIETASTLWPLSQTAEITLEANPEDVTLSLLREWQCAGVNRLSLGVQALNDDALNFLGRAHTKAGALTSIDDALSVFDNVSIDLIYARPGQSIKAWLSELSDALDTGAPHLSLYELTIKEKTAFAKQVERAAFTPMDDDAQADLYLETLRLTEEAGMPAYEVSNHARSEAYWSRHNLTYWLAGDWLGIGPGAEGRFTYEGTRYARKGALRPADYINAVDQDGYDVLPGQVLNSEEQAHEYLIMGLRSKLGISANTYTALSGTPLSASKIEALQQSGHLRHEDGRITLTKEGWLLADYIAQNLAS